MRRRDIDALRAIAIFGVVLYHVGLPGFKNGYTGVDIFFVVSGYLILGNVLKSVGEGEFVLSRYLEKRLRRVLPAVVLVLSINLLFVFALFSPADIKEILKSYLSIIVFLPNAYFWQRSGYFDPVAELQPFLHTWSLGIELQFYIAVGIAAYLLQRFRKIDAIGSGLFIVAFSSFMLCLILAHWKPGANFYLLPSRLWEFALGGLTAMYSQRVTEKFPTLINSALLRTLGFSILICTICFPLSFSLWPSVFTLSPVLGTILVLSGKETSRITSLIFENRIFILSGKVSFGWFLWHWPLIVYANYASDGQVSTELLLCLALFALLLAVLQWKFFELRFNDYSRMTSKRFKQITVTGSLFLLLIAVTGIQSNGFQQAWANLRTGYMEESVVTIFLRNRIEQNIFVADSRCSITYDSLSDYDRELVEYCKNLYGPATLIIGDSHGVVIYDIIRKLNLPVFVINWSRPASRPSSGIEGQYQDVLSYLEIYPNTASKVLFVQSGSYLLEDELGKVDSNEIFRSSTRSKPAIEEIDLTLRYLQQLANLVNVVWIGPYVQSRVNINNPSNWYSSKSISKVAVSKFIELDLYLKNVLEKSRVSYISTIETLRFPGDRIVVGNCIAWRDGDHFSECGRSLLASSEYSFFSSILE